MSEHTPDPALRSLLECLLFLHNDPVRAGDIAEVYGLEKAAVTAELESMARDWPEDPARGLEIQNVAGGWRLATRAAHSQDLRKFFKARPQPLSQAAMETLAIVAYRQPVMRSELEQVRGVDCGGTLRNLLDRGLIKIHGKKELPGRPLVYTTTKRFLEVFNLASLSQLPALKDLSEIDGGPSNLELFPGQEFVPPHVEGVDTQEPPLPPLRPPEERVFESNIASDEEDLPDWDNENETEKTQREAAPESDGEDTDTGAGPREAAQENGGEDGDSESGGGQDDPDEDVDNEDDYEEDEEDDGDLDDDEYEDDEDDPEDQEDGDDLDDDEEDESDDEEKGR